MDYESQRTRDLGCWDPTEFISQAVAALAEPVGDDWTIPTEMIDAVLGAGFGADIPDETRAFWHETHRTNYAGDAGRRRLRTSFINLRDRDGLHGRLDAVRCPVLWLQGSADEVYSVANAQEEIAMFSNSANARLQIVEGGQHFLSASHPDEVTGLRWHSSTRWVEVVAGCTKWTSKRNVHLHLFDTCRSAGLG